MITIVIKGLKTNSCSPGDKITISGILCAAPPEDKKGKGALVHEIFVEAMEIRKEKKAFAEELIDMDAINEIK